MDGARQTYEIPNSKHQITNKFQIPILNDQTGLECSGNLVIVICLIFEICDLKP